MEVELGLLIAIRMRPLVFLPHKLSGGIKKSLHPALPVHVLVRFVPTYFYFEFLGYLPVGEAQFLQLKKKFNSAHVNCFSCHFLYLLFPGQRYVI